MEFEYLTVNVLYVNDRPLVTREGGKPLFSKATRYKGCLGWDDYLTAKGKSGWRLIGGLVNTGKHGLLGVFIKPSPVG